VASMKRVRVARVKVLAALQLGEVALFHTQGLSELLLGQAHGWYSPNFALTHQQLDVGVTSLPSNGTSAARRLRLPLSGRGPLT
jgi:hypothetical protein